ncbi:hypothetical protein EJ08DRAFT_648369 [Tothia fuscella]|uniref:Uncharacterized protein n=1 Tax=Tothia fuscella TaxID=1048955 RepID=A0A9P4NV51_9PEZI|nr:hypothetical protein EJ08DRAFT_648369 [Tothia fuscella]
MKATTAILRFITVTLCSSAISAAPLAQNDASASVPTVPGTSIKSGPVFFPAGSVPQIDPNPVSINAIPAALNHDMRDDMNNDASGMMNVQDSENDNTDNSDMTKITACFTPEVYNDCWSPNVHFGTCYNFPGARRPVFYFSKYAGATCILYDFGDCIGDAKPVLETGYLDQSEFSVGKGSVVCYAQA